MTDYRNISMWHDTAGDEWNPRPSLPGPTEVDVAIIGAGFTGLWTAYYLKKTDPSLRIAVVEKEVAGFGPSGRNGGWCSHLFATPLHKLAKDTDRQSAIAQNRAMFDTVREVGRVVSQEGIDCDFYQGGNLHFATTPAQLTRLQQEMDHFRSWGFGEEDYRLLSAEEAMSELLPPTAKAKITHRWGGPVGLPRDWYSSVGLDRSSGIAWAGGYVGDGVSTTNLAGRTLADLITETDSDLTSLPWVNHKSRKWEPEPLRWIAVNLTLGVMGRADAEEHRTGRPSRRAELLDKLVGR